jgi:hypothetical protein
MNVLEAIADAAEFSSGIGRPVIFKMKPNGVCTITVEGADAPAIQFRIDPDRIGSERKPIPQHIRKAVQKRDGDMCRYCGCEKGPFQLDHVHPYSRGGKNTVKNLVVACKPCNKSKHAKTLDEWKEGKYAALVP